MDATPSPVGALLLLAGGESRRLGRPKAWLAWEGEPLLARVARRLEVLAPGEVVVAARPGQDLPDLPGRRVDDDRPGEGPLAGLAAGLSDVAARHGTATRVAVSACDHPEADPALFRALADLLGTADVAVVRHAGRLHVLQAVWRAGLGERCAEALDRGERRVRRVVEAVSGRIVEPEELPGAIDLPRALLNVNDSGDVARARRSSGDDA